VRAQPRTLFRAKPEDRREIEPGSNKKVLRAPLEFSAFESKKRLISNRKSGV
jgi:hypothetical protein